MVIKKRFGARNFVSYLGLKDVYSIGSKPRKSQQSYVKEGSGYLYKQAPPEKKQIQNDKTHWWVNLVHGKNYGGS